MTAPRHGTVDLGDDIAPTDRALRGAARAHLACSPGAHADDCPGALDHDDDLLTGPMSRRRTGAAA